MRSWSMKRPPELVADPIDPSYYVELLAALTEILYQSFNQTPHLPDHDPTRQTVNRRKRGSL